MRRETYVGHWWLPESEGMRLAGTLDVYPDEPPSLQLIGAFGGPEMWSAIETRYNRILGFTDKGKLMTLLDGFQSEAQFNNPGITMEKIVAPLVLVGAHLTATDFSVSEARVEFADLDQWLMAGFDEQVGEDRKSYRVAFTPREYPALTVGEAVIRVGVGWQVFGNGIEQRGLKVLPGFRFGFGEPVPFEDVRRSWLAPLQNLLTLAADRPMPITALRIRSPAATVRDEQDWIDVQFPVQLPTFRRGRPLSWADMMIRYTNIADDFEPLLQGWYRIASELQEVCSLYFSTRYRRGYTEADFLSLAHALEVFDRRRNGDRLIPRDRHRTRIRTILKAAPDELRTWLRDALAYSNEPSFRQRLERLMPEVEALVAPIVDAPVRFIARTVDTRNYYTHYSPQLAARAVRGNDLYWLNQQLGVMIAGLLLLEAGLEPGRVRDIFWEHQAYVQMRQRAEAQRQ
jgi:hypothetical protein